MQVSNIFKSRGRRIVLFLLILSALLFALSSGLIYAVFHHEKFVHPKLKHLISVQMEPAETLDVIVLGNSLSYTSVVPMELWDTLGITVYDAGHSGQSMQEAYETLKVIYQTQSPKTILLETGLLYWGAQGASAWVDQLNTWLDYHFPLYHFHDVWKSYATGKTYEEENIKGYAFRKNNAPYTGPDYLTETDETEEFPDLIEKDFLKLLKLCREHDTELILFSTISPDNYSSKRLNRIRNLAEQNTLTYYDFNHLQNEIGFDWQTDCLDGGDHINHSGAVKVTAYFAEQLTGDVRLTDHRDDPAYASWFETSKYYHSRDKITDKS